jgi:hypothetical protein
MHEAHETNSSPLANLFVSYRGLLLFLAFFLAFAGLGVTPIPSAIDRSLIAKRVIVVLATLPMCWSAWMLFSSRESVALTYRILATCAAFALTFSITALLVRMFTTLNNPAQFLLGPIFDTPWIRYSIVFKAMAIVGTFLGAVKARPALLTTLVLVCLVW